MIEYSNIIMLNSTNKTNRQLVGVDIFSGVTYTDQTDEYTYNITQNVSITGYSYSSYTSYHHVTFDYYSTGLTHTTGYTTSVNEILRTYNTGFTHTTLLMYSGETYNWQVYIPIGSDINQYITSNMQLYLNDIQRKEAEWVIAPKTKWIAGPGGTPIEVPVQKSEIVKPTIPDYEEMARDDYYDISAIKRLLVKLMADVYNNPNITQQDIDDLAVVQTDYQVNKYYASGNTFSFEGKLYEVIQSHTTQADWYPPTTPALYKIKVPAGTITEWVQPTGAHDDYNLGDKVTHNSFTWQSTVDNNVWEPGVYGWVQI